MNHKDSVSILSLLRPLVKQILEDMMEEERREYLQELRERINMKTKINQERMNNEKKEIGIKKELEESNIPCNFNDFGSLENFNLDNLDLSNIKANGYYKRNLNTIIGEIENLKVPRTRDGKFHSVLIPYKRKNTFKLDQIVRALFTSGISTRKIGDILKELYGISLSYATISNMANIAIEDIEKWKNRKLHSEYAVLFLDATYFPIKRDTVEKEAIYIVSGILPDGHREILGYWIPSGREKASIWSDILLELKEKRGIGKVYFIVSDDLTGIDDVISDIFPDAIHQLCINHIMRNIEKYVRVKDRQEIINDFKEIYKSKIKLRQVKGFYYL